MIASLDPANRVGVFIRALRTDVFHMALQPTFRRFTFHRFFGREVLRATVAMTQTVSSPHIAFVTYDDTGTPAMRAERVVADGKNLLARITGHIGHYFPPI